MKLDNKLLMAAAIVTILNFHNCTKYEDNPAFSLSTKKSRLVGTWEIVKVGGYSYSSSSDIYFFEFERDGDFEQGYIEDDGSIYAYGGEWEWEDNKKILEIERNSYYGYVLKFQIKKLTNKELKLELNGEEWELEKM